VSCRHLAAITKRWAKASCEGEALPLSPSMAQGFSLLCCAHAALGLKLGGVSLEAARSSVRRALADAPFLVADDGTLLPGRHVCTELFSDLGPYARACPSYMAALIPFLDEVGGVLSSTQLAGASVEVRSDNPYALLLPKLMAECDRPNYADIAFHFGEGEDVVYGHRLVLGLLVPTLGVAFTSGMHGGATLDGRTRIALGGQGFGPTALRLVLRYVYTGELEVCHEPQYVRGTCLSPSPAGVDLLLETLRVADFWDMHHLKESCEALAVQWDLLQVENCCALYEHATHLNCSQLRVACIQYIRDMHDAVSLSEGWAGLSEEMKRPIVELSKPKARW